MATPLDTLPDAGPLFAGHIDAVAGRWREALTGAGFDAAVIDAGDPRLYFQDDQAAPFRPNPHFAQWYPDRDCAGARLLLRPGRKPRLYFVCPRDYWHLPPAPPRWFEAYGELEVYADGEALERALGRVLQSINRTAWIGERVPDRLSPEAHNPAQVLHPLDYARAYKTPFEQACLAAASRRAAAGHRAVAAAYRDGAVSEFELLCAYLAASRQTAEDLPYPSIIAQNEHAGVLHYQHYDRAAPPVAHSLLIDAGATSQGYAADVTRSYAAAGGDFAALIDRLAALQQQIIAEIAPGRSYGELHELTHRRLAEVLVDAELARGTPEAVFEAGVTRSFLPHGLGHLLGLQTHDVGGQQVSPDGGHEAPPPAYPALRLTRRIEVDQVFTIEPGLYFIPLLLDELRNGSNAGLVDWGRIDALAPCGGIRIEDNVLVREDGLVNLTRDAFAEAQP